MALDQVTETPWNPTTGKAYQGGNIMRLLVAADEQGYQGGRWAGYGQWQAAGRQVRKGEHGTACMTVVRVGADKESGRKGRTAPRGFRVFHFDQTDPKSEVVP